MKEFSSSILTTATVSAAEAEVDTVAQAAAEAAMNQLALTSGDDSIVGTAADDYINATTVGTLGANDVILDSSVTDHDILDATVTSNSINARIQDIETLNITGKYVTTGLDLTSVTGTDTLNLNTELAGGTATVLAANSINATNIVAGSNITTLNVTSLSSGTRDTVAVNGGSADVNLTGNAGGADSYDVTLAADKTLTLDTMDSAGDAVTVDAAGDFTLVNNTGTFAELAVTITNDSADAITVTEADNNLFAKTVTLAGNAITIDATDGDAVNGIAITSSAASSTIKVSGDTGTHAIDLAGAEVTNVSLSSADITAIQVNEGSQLDLDVDSGTDGLALSIDNADGDLVTGTLLLNVNESQTVGLSTAATVDTVLLTAGALADDANGNTQTVTITELGLDAATNNVVFNGENNVTITALTNHGDETIVASGFTGDLTIDSFSESAKVYGGSGDDSFTSAKSLEVYAGAGDDSVDVTGAAAGSVINTEAGDDSVTTSGNGDTVDLGVGDDKVTLTGGADTVTLGDGADTVSADVANASTIEDLVTGTDTITLTGALAGDLNVTDLSQTDSVYDLDGDANTAGMTLTGVTATDLSDTIQLDVTVGAHTVVGGALDDSFDSSDAASDITTGAGADEVTVSATGGTVEDFTTGTDKVIYTVAAAGNVDLTDATVSSGTYDIDGTGNGFTLTDHTETDLTSMVQLGSSTAAFVDDVDSTAVTGGAFDDYITLGATEGNAQTVNFIDNGGFDTITGFATGEDTLSFADMTGINAGAGVLATSAVDDAVDGTVYILDNTSVNSDTVDFSVIGTSVNNETVTINTASVVDDVATYINNVLGTTTGETYVVALESSATNTYLYEVNGDTDGITASDISLIGQVTSDDALVAGDIA